MAGDRRENHVENASLFDEKKMSQNEKHRRLHVKRKVKDESVCFENRDE